MVVTLWIHPERVCLREVLHSVKSANLTICSYLEMARDRMQVNPNRKSHMGFRLVPNPMTRMTLNGTMAIILRNSAEFGSFEGQLGQSA